MTTSMVPLLIQAILINNQQQASQLCPTSRVLAADNPGGLGMY